MFVKFTPVFTLDIYQKCWSVIECFYLSRSSPQTSLSLPLPYSARPTVVLRPFANFRYTRCSLWCCHCQALSRTHTHNNRRHILLISKRFPVRATLKCTKHIFLVNFWLRLADETNYFPRSYSYSMCKTSDYLAKSIARGQLEFVCQYRCRCMYVGVWECAMWIANDELWQQRQCEVCKRDESSQWWCACDGDAAVRPKSKAGVERKKSCEKLRRSSKWISYTFDITLNLITKTSEFLHSAPPILHSFFSGLISTVRLPFCALARWLDGSLCVTVIPHIYIRLWIEAKGMGAVNIDAGDGNIECVGT